MRKYYPVLFRILFSVLIGILISALLSEVAYRLLGRESRPPKVVMLDIPPGTAAEVARGEQSSAIPANMTFVVGDTFIVRNDDSVPHQLGPHYIPVGSTASMTLGQSESLSFSCSFRRDQLFGLTVNEPLTLGVRLYGILFAGIPLGGLIGLYSFLVRPLKQTSTTPPSA